MCLPITRDLPANATYTKRRFSFLPTPGTDHDALPEPARMPEAPF